jgi:hypothetical protein
MISLDMDLHEAGSDFLVEQAIEIDRQHVLLTGNARRDVVVDGVGHSIDVDQAAAGRGSSRACHSRTPGL